MRTIKTYSNRAPFYNAFTRTERSLINAQVLNPSGVVIEVRHAKFVDDDLT